MKMKPAMTMIETTVRILLDPRMCNLSTDGACDWMSETFRDLEGAGLVDWAYVRAPLEILVPVNYEEGDFINEHRLEE